MGQRANLVIVENRQYHLYYSHWCANTITRNLFWGPDHAIRFIRIQREEDESGWLDDIWAEGGAVVDLDKRVLLLYGGEDLLYEVPLRRVYLEMLRRAWSPWEVRWAHEGIADMADYVGYPRAKVLSNRSRPIAPVISPREPCYGRDTIATFRLPDGALRVYPLAAWVESYLLTGPDLMAQCDHSTDAGSLPLDDWIPDDFPRGGFHVDLAARALEYWKAADAPGLLERLRAMWTDWSVTWHRDRFEAQVEATDHKLRLPIPSAEQLRERTRAMLLQDYGRGGVETIRAVAEEDRKAAKEVEINQRALRDDRLELPMPERQRIVEIALGAGDTG
ncbi:MAG: hypothetical protein HQ582_27540 [Planctomycetes bacterium]|nr:hypothetical protein [Planctomycetota bacterium]